jgi:hypothetical protein
VHEVRDLGNLVSKDDHSSVPFLILSRKIARWLIIPHIFYPIV